MTSRNERVFALLKKQGKKKADMARALDISKSAITQWEKKGVEPSYEQCLVLANFFDVPVDYLYNGKTDNDFDVIVEYRSTLQNEEQLKRIWHYLSMLNPDGQRALDDYANFLTGLDKYRVDIENVVDVPCAMPAAAHERTDIEVTDDMRKNDDDIMDSEDF